MKADRFKKIIFIVAWLVIWQVISLIVNNKILLAGPYETGKALIALSVTGSFWISIALTSLRILSGFIAGSAIGIILAYISCRIKIFEEFISPVVSVIKSIPVASFVILLLIWFGAPLLSLFVTALVVFPMMYINILEGLRSTDTKLLEMARIFRMRDSKIALYIYLPSLKPFLAGAFKLSCGMAWKSGIAAEVIARPLNSVGNNIYLSKVYIDTADLFAWTAMAVLLAFLCEKLITLAARRVLK